MINLLDQYGWCPFCLSIQNTMAHVTVQYINSAPNAEVAPQGILTNPPELSKWLYDHYTENFRAFTLNAASYAFVPIAVIKQTPVCVMHLWDITSIPQRIKL